MASDGSCDPLEICERTTARTMGLDVGLKKVGCARENDSFEPVENDGSETTPFDVVQSRST